jgi:hypothetical protein
MSEGVIPERITGETVKAYKAFVDYCEMGGGRSVPRLWAQYRHLDVTEPAPTKRLRTLKGWSASNGWQARAAEYERRSAEARAVALIAKQIEWKDRAVRDAERLVKWWDHTFGQVEETPKGVSAYQVREMGKLRKEADDLGRRSLDLPNNVTESTIKGTGQGGAVKVEHTGGVQVYIPDNGRNDRD